MNLVALIGRLAQDPEMRYTQSDLAVCRFTLAVDREKKQSGDNQADFIRIVCWGKTAENVDRYLHKGSQCAVHGRIETGSYKNKNGDTVYTTEISAQRVEFLGGGQRVDNGQKTQPRSNMGQIEAYEQQVYDYDLPTGYAAVDDDIQF